MKIRRHPTAPIILLALAATTSCSMQNDDQDGKGGDGGNRERSSAYLSQQTMLLAKQSGCLACHDVDRNVVGPRWRDVSIRYRDDMKAAQTLVAKVKNGGKGQWGDVPMPPYYPRISDTTITTLVEAILALADSGDGSPPPIDGAAPAGSPLTGEQFLTLAKNSGCLACHSLEKKVVGPAWQDVSERYKDDADARRRLQDKIANGGKGQWGEVPMPPYSPRVSPENIGLLVDYIVALRGTSGNLLPLDRGAVEGALSAGESRDYVLLVVSGHAYHLRLDARSGDADLSVRTAAPGQDGVIIDTQEHRDAGEASSFVADFTGFYSVTVSAVQDTQYSLQAGEITGEIFQSLAENHGCHACHLPFDASTGPAWLSIANYYRHADGARGGLLEKVRNGGSGVWGNNAMPAQSPGVSDQDINLLLAYILSLRDAFELVANGDAKTGSLAMQQTDSYRFIGEMDMRYTIRLESLAGDADLFVYRLQGGGPRVRAGASEYKIPVDTVTVNSRESNLYDVDVHGYLASDYTLALTAVSLPPLLARPFPSQQELDQYAYFLNSDTLNLARQSGCLACHSVDRNVVGPAWKAVSLRFKDVAGSRARLIDKVQLGGRNYWGDAPMPPYSPRVPDADIETLVDSILFGDPPAGP